MAVSLLTFLISQSRQRSQGLSQINLILISEVQHLQSQAPAKEYTVYLQYRSWYEIVIRLLINSLWPYLFGFFFCPRNGCVFVIS